MKVAIVGYGIEGEAALKYWLTRNAIVTVCDQDPTKQLPVGIERQLGEGYLDNLDRFDVVWRTAGINPEIILAKNPGISEKITTTMNEFLRVCPTRHVIGVTGTKGKGTTSTLIAKLLEAAGETVFLGGNIGISPFDFLPQLRETSWVVLELSSFQLCDITHGTEIAVCLMVVPEHLNWHKDLADYLRAKAQLFAHQQPSDIAIYFADNDNAKAIAAHSPGIKVPYFAEPGAHVENNSIVIARQTVVRTDELKLLGAHNWQNVCAAVTAAWQVTQNILAMRSVLTSFSGLEHRLEFVREVNGVKYCDDSFGTTPETAMVALQAFSEPKIVILGGSDKGADYDELAKVVASSHMRKVLLIGDQAQRIQASLEKVGFTNFALGGSNMAEIVHRACSLAQPGDVVILSPACASFDMFHDYKDRGNQFKQTVANL